MARRGQRAAKTIRKGLIHDDLGILLRKKIYDASTLQKTIDYIEGIVYEDGALGHFPSAEGRVRYASSTFTNEYMIADHLGNVRVSFEEQDGAAVLRQENGYYPFGLNHPGSTTPS